MGFGTGWLEVMAVGGAGLGIRVGMSRLSVGGLVPGLENGQFLRFQSLQGTVAGCWVETLLIVGECWSDWALLSLGQEGAGWGWDWQRWK
jgi:hypothetical protein